jgi:hypothetical protein
VFFHRQWSSTAVKQHQDDVDRGTHAIRKGELSGDIEGFKRKQAGLTTQRDQVPQHIKAHHRCGQFQGGRRG